MYQHTCLQVKTKDALACSNHVKQRQARDKFNQFPEAAKAAPETFTRMNTLVHWSPTRRFSKYDKTVESSPFLGFKFTKFISSLYFKVEENHRVSYYTKPNLTASYNEKSQFEFGMKLDDNNGTLVDGCGTSSSATESLTPRTSVRGF